MNTLFIQIDELKLVNVDFIVTVTLNRNREHGWIKVDDKEDGGFSKYKVSYELYKHIVKVLAEREMVIGLEEAKNYRYSPNHTSDSIMEQITGHARPTVDADKDWQKV